MASIAIAFLGYTFATALSQLNIFEGQPHSIDWRKLLAKQDGHHYYCIALSGYSYNPGQRSIVAFFPAYPLLARVVASALAIDALTALMLVSNVCAWAACIVLVRYCRVRDTGEQSASGHAVALFALWPTALFLKLGYTESLFALVMAIALLGMARDWSPPLLALIVGFGTAVRPVGIALSVSFLTYRLCRSRQGWRSILELACLAPVSCWGLLAYMAYLQDTLGMPLAFAQTQEYWKLGASTAGFENKSLALLALEPIWAVYDPASPRYWGTLQPNVPAFFNLIFWNPILFMLAFVLVLIGAVRRQLTLWECVLGLMLLLIPYVTRSYEMSMASHGRFALVVLPAFVVLSRLMARLPNVVTACVYAILGCWSFAWAVLFALKVNMI